MGEALLAGIDGGGTKTAGVLLTATGRVLATATTGPSILDARPGARACAELRAAADALCERASVDRDAVTFWGLGVNGVDFADEHAAQHAAVCGHLGIPADRTVLVNDGIGALWGASSEARSVNVQHGTGFTAAYRSRLGSEELFDHLGTGLVFDIRRQVLPLVVRMIDGRRPATSLRDAILAHFGVGDPRQFSAAVYRRRFPRHLLKTTQKVVLCAWRDGDPAAESLLAAAIEDYALAAGAMAAHIGPGRPASVTFGGGMISHWPAELWERLACAARRACPKARVHAPLLSPAYGNAVMAAHHAGMEAGALFIGIRENGVRNEGVA